MSERSQTTGIVSINMAQPNMFSYVDTRIANAITEWRIARAEKEIAVAKNARRDLWGTIVGGGPSVAAANVHVRIAQCERELIDNVPESMLTAREMLRIVLEMMAEGETETGFDDEDSVTRDKPMMRLVRNALAALDWADGDLLLCSSGRKKELRRDARPSSVTRLAPPPPPSA